MCRRRRRKGSIVLVPMKGAGRRGREPAGDGTAGRVGVAVLMAPPGFDGPPDQRRERFEREYGLPRYDAEVLTAEKPLADYFEETAAGFPQAKTVSNWLMTEVLGKLRESGGTIADFAVRPAGVAEKVSTR